jgi:hypothetical protein
MAQAQTNTAVIKAPSRKLFAPMFKARWQNLQNIVNDSAFIDLIPEPYLSYYMAYTRQWLQWSRGFVPMLHRQDFFSTGMGYTVCEILTRECLSGGYRIESKDDKTLKMLENWGKKTKLSNEFYRMFFNSNSGGNALLVLTPVNGDVYLSTYPVDRCIFQINRTEDVTSVMLLNRFTAGETAYYVKEVREIIDGKGYYKVMLAKGTLVNSPTWQSDILKQIPNCIENQFRFSYGDIEINTWYELPNGIRNIGVYNVKNKAQAVAIADMPGYADSSLHTALDVLYSIDYNYTQAQVDMYMGKSRALIPKQMQSATINTGRVNVAEGLSFSENIRQAQLEEDFYTEIFTQGGEPVKPTFIQADLRGEAHKYIRDSDLELLASKVGLSSSTLANHLTYNNSKTATEVRSEQDTTEKTVNEKRALANEPINQMLSDVARYYGYLGDVEINWGRAGANSSIENQELLQDFNAGLLPLRKYLKKRWSDLSEEEIEQWAIEIEEEQEKKAKRESLGSLGFNDSNYFGDETNV